MKTNIKNGVIYLGEVITDIATIKIDGGSGTPFELSTGGDGCFSLIGHTNEHGSLEAIVIQMDAYSFNIFDARKEVVEIDPQDIIVKDGKPYEPTNE